MVTRAFYCSQYSCVWFRKRKYIHGKQNKTKFQTETRLLPIKGFELEALCYKERLANASGTETVSLMQPNGWKDNLKGNSFL